jgi:hypothetical protein
MEGSFNDAIAEQETLLLAYQLVKEQTDADESYARQVQVADEAYTWQVQVADEGVWGWFWQWVGSKVHLGW